MVFLGPLEGEVDSQVRALAPSALVIRADPALGQAAGLDRLIAQGQRLAALLANDNGVGHLMGASGTPVVSLFGPTDPRRWAPVAPASRIVRAQDFGGEAMEAIPPLPVVEAVMEMLAARGCA